jgi:hypothetical protein
MSGALTKMYENLSTDDTDSHRFFFSLRPLRLCGSLFSQNDQVVMVFCRNKSSSAGGRGSGDSVA